MNFINSIYAVLNANNITIFYNSPDSYNSSPQCAVTVRGVVRRGTTDIVTMANVEVWIEQPDEELREMDLEAGVHRIAGILRDIGYYVDSGRMKPLKGDDNWAGIMLGFEEDNDGTT